MGEWISVEDKKPEVADGALVMVDVRYTQGHEGQIFYGKVKFFGRGSSKNGFYDWSGINMDKHVANWRLTPPKEEQGR